MLNQGPNEHKLEIPEAAPSAALTVKQFPSPPALLVLEQGWSRQNSGQFAGNLWPRCDIPYCVRLTILASEVCSDDLCQYAATGFVLDPSGDAAPTVEKF